MAKIKDFLRPTHPTVALTATLESIVDRFIDRSWPEEEKADCLVVVGVDDRPVGLINASLLLEAVAVGAKKQDEPTVDALMKDRFLLPVSSAMAEEFPVVHPEADLFAVIPMLGKHYFECLPVMRGSEYLGAVRTIDLFQAIAEEVLGVSSGGLFTD